MCFFSSHSDRNTFQLDKKDPAPKKKAKKVVVEEPVDPVCISYVKSCKFLARMKHSLHQVLDYFNFIPVWEKYCDEIGTDNGPIRHVDESNAQDYPHLNNFVAFDMEHWWAERSISCMIKESPQPAAADASSASSIFKREASAEAIDLSSMNSCFNIKLNQSWPNQKSIQSLNLSQLVIC